MPISTGFILTGLGFETLHFSDKIKTRGEKTQTITGVDYQLMMIYNYIL